MVMPSVGKVCNAFYMGVVPYYTALRQQEETVQARLKGIIPDTLILLQHPHVITTGRFRGQNDILIPRYVLKREGIDVFHTNRGGGVTYHGPGQLVGYPIINLRENHLGIRQYVWCLEEVIIKVLSFLGIGGQRREKYTGVWVGGRKICSIGVRVAHYITMHGFALNVNCDTRYFAYINPCGLDSSNITSLADELVTDVTIENVVESLIPAFCYIFDKKREVVSAQ